MRGSFSKEVPSELRDKGLGLGEPGVSGLGMEWPKAVRIGPVCVCVHACVLSPFSRAQLFVTLGTTARQAPQSMGLPRQESWSGLPLPSPGDLPSSGMEATSLMSPALAGRLFSPSATWEARIGPKSHKNYHQPRTGCPGSGAHPVPSAVVRGHVASSSSGGVVDSPAIPTKKQQFYCENPPRA